VRKIEELNLVNNKKKYPLKKIKKIQFRNLNSKKKYEI